MEYPASRIIVDTDVLIDFLQGKERAVKKIKELTASGALLATTAINVFEISWGAYRLRRIKDIEDLMETMAVLNLTTREAIKAGEEMAYLSSVGQVIDIRDLLIGVTARENGYVIITGNIGHFNKIRGLQAIEYKPQ